MFYVSFESAEGIRTGSQSGGDVCTFAGHLLLRKFPSLLSLTNASTEATDTQENLKLHVPL
jgi:hypothetical protein